MRIHPVFHASLLRKYRPRQATDGTPIHPAPLLHMILSDTTEFRVEMIIKDRDKEILVRTNAHAVPHRRIQKEFLVKWEGYPVEHNQWIPEAELEAFRPAINAYLAINAQVAASQRPMLRAAMLWHQKVKWCRPIGLRKRDCTHTHVESAAESMACACGMNMLMEEQGRSQSGREFLSMSSGSEVICNAVVALYSVAH
jgi:hypothetical protein